MQASMSRQYGGPDALVPDEPAWHAWGAREPSAELRAVRPRIDELLATYYDTEHLARAGDWMLALAPDAPDHLVVAALLHDVERMVPGGPAMDLGVTPWDDADYNGAHTARSAVVAPTWLLLQDDVPREWLVAVAQPIREHEFGGSPEGDLMQAADSISFLETNVPLVVGWARSERCSIEHARRKLQWMGERVRHERGRAIARVYMERALREFDETVGARAA